MQAAALLTGERRRAEDLLQRALAPLWPWRRLAEGGNPEAYQRRALFSTYLSWWRRWWRAEVPSLSLPDGYEGNDVAAESTTRDAVRRALATLSHRQCAEVVLRYVEDLSVAETAELLGSLIGAVKVHAARALAEPRADPNLRIPTVEESHPMSNEDLRRLVDAAPHVAVGCAVTPRTRTRRLAYSICGANSSISSAIVAGVRPTYGGADWEQADAPNGVERLRTALTCANRRGVTCRSSGLCWSARRWIFVDTNALNGSQPR